VICLFLSLATNARADTIDDFTLVGDGHIITYSLPASAVIMDHPHGVSLFANAAATIDGVPGYSMSGQYFVPPLVLPWDMILSVPPSISGGTLLFSGPLLLEISEIIPVSNPSVSHPDDLLVTFIPGTYDLTAFNPPVNGLTPPPYFFTLTISPETSPDTAPVPEPSSLMLLAIGALLGARAIRSRHLGEAAR